MVAIHAREALPRYGPDGPPPHSTWLIGRRADLTWLIGSASYAFAAVAAFHLLTGVAGIDQGIAVGVLYLSWAIGFDGTHLFATYSRTYLDAQFRVERRALLYMSIAVFALGPLLVLGFHLLLGPDSARAFAVVFNRFGLTWGYFHLCRQHWGIASLYRAKGREHTRAARRSDALLLGFGLTFPYAYTTAHVSTPLSFAETLPLAASTWETLCGALLVVGALFLAPGVTLRARGEIANLTLSVSRYLGATLLVCGCSVAAALAVGLDRLLVGAQWLLGVGFLVALGYAAAHELASRRGGAPSNLPRWLLLASALLTHNALLAMTELPPAIPVLALTLFHNVQYHRIVWFHNVNRYGADPDGANFGIAGLLTRRLLAYACAATIFSALYVLPKAANAAFMRHELAHYTLLAFFWGFAFHHYLLDAVIWRPGRSPTVAANLGIADR